MTAMVRIRTGTFQDGGFCKQTFPVCFEARTTRHTISAAIKKSGFFGLAGAQIVARGPHFGESQLEKV
jgi:hypothetical protein